MNKFKGKYNIDEVKLEEITILQASINNNAGLTNLQKGWELDMSFRVVPGISLHLKKVRLTFNCDITIYKDKSKSEPLGVEGKFQIAYTLQIDNLTDLVTVGNDELADVSDELIGSLANIVYSTSRGIIYTRCLGTVLGKIILPVLSTPKVLGIN